MAEEISSPERHRPAACPVRRRLGGLGASEWRRGRSAPDSL